MECPARCTDNGGDGVVDRSIMEQVVPCQQRLLVVEAKPPYAFYVPEGRRVTGQKWLPGTDWPWRDSGRVPGMRDVRMTATSPTYGRVTVKLVDPQGRGLYDLLRWDTSMSALRLIKA